ncbi:MAG: hypothetical protein HC806_10605 [Anaerolineae bacterium]|nr:hypothetical protein [Anaerolineae bacterium]
MVVTIPSILISLGFLPNHYEMLYGLCQRDTLVIQQMGFSVKYCADYLISFSLLTLLTISGIVTLIFWRKSDDWMALLTVSMLIPIVVIITEFNALVVVPTAWEKPVTFVRIIGPALFIVYGFIFPDGRFVPRWGSVISFFGILLCLSWAIFPESPINTYNIETWPLGFFVSGALYIGGVLAQLYRYFRVSNPIFKRQTSWIVLGWTTAILIYMGVFLPLSIFPELNLPGKPRIIYTLIANPVIQAALLFAISCIAISILRYRLWDIEFFIRRTLQYALLTGLLALIYFSGIVVIQLIISPLTGETNFPIITVITTLGIAALFTPLRHRVQDFIDRRFFRKKYDTEQTLAQFALIARDEVDMDKLTAALLGVVEETMQPERVTLWIKNSTQRRGEAKLN